MQEEEAPAPQDALPLQLVLRNSSSKAVIAAAPASVCTLLATSKHTSSMVEAELQGCLDVTAQPKRLAQAKSFAAWLPAHGRLIRSLEFDAALPWELPQRKEWEMNSRWAKEDTPPSCCGDSSSEDNAAAGRALAAAFQAAGQLGGSLSGLRSFSCSKIDAAPQLWLTSLPTGLTQLKLDWLSSTCSFFPEIRKDWVAPLGKGLTRLTGLRSLTLNIHDVDDEFWMDGLSTKICSFISPLTCLTELVLTGLTFGTENGFYGDDVLNLPSSLRRLILPSPFSRASGPICWGARTGPLAGLTELHLTHEIELDDFDEWDPNTEEGAVFPPNLVRLTGCGKGPGHPIAVLTQLTALTHLDGVFSRQDAAKLRAAAPGLQPLWVRKS